MAMRTASPWWLSLVLGIGLLFLFLGERLFGHEPRRPRMMITGLGLLAVLGVTALRAWTTVALTGSRRNVERTLLLCQLGTLLGPGPLRADHEAGAGPLPAARTRARSGSRPRSPWCGRSCCVVVARSRCS